VNHSGLAEQLAARRLPAVDVSWHPYAAAHGIPRCTSDDDAAGAICADYFLDRGFRQFAYCGAAERVGIADRLGNAFVRRLRTRGRETSRFVPSAPLAVPVWRRLLQERSDWLRSLEKPVGLLAFDNPTARQLEIACRFAELRIPEEVALLAGDADELFGEMSGLRISSIDLRPRRVGWEAAALLDRMMQGEPAPTAPIFLPPSHVVTRDSTDVLAIDDPELAKALRFMREHACEPIRVRDVLAETPLGRRTLEQRCVELLGRTPAAELRRLRLEHARRWLEETDAPVARIASACGFQRAEILARVFRRELDQTPSAYRAAARGQWGADA
jgi:LacI family transcriptional regulator